MNGFCLLLVQANEISPISLAHWLCVLPISLPVTPLDDFHLLNRQGKTSEHPEGGQWDGALRWNTVRSDAHSSMDR